MVTKYKNEDVFPKFGTEDWDIVRREGLENFVKELYEVEPAVFMKLNKEQKRVFLELLNLVMDSGERDSLFKILDAVVELDSNDRKEFAKILEITRLKQVVSTIKLISDRLLTLENLKKIVFNHTLQANEVRDLQSFIEKHYWIFGEEYRMVCAEEVKFEEALRKYIYILRGVSEKKYIAHPNKYKEMDLFLTLFETISYGEKNCMFQCLYKIKNFNVGAGMLFPFQPKGWSGGTKLLSKEVRKETWSFIKDNGNMFLLSLSWDFSVGKKHNAEGKTINNVDRETGIAM